MSAKHHDAMESVPGFGKRLRADCTAAQRGKDSQQQAVLSKANTFRNPIAGSFGERLPTWRFRLRGIGKIDEK